MMMNTTTSDASGPIHTQRNPFPEALEALLHFGGQVLAVPDECFAADLTRGDTRCPLCESLSGQAIVVEAEGVKHLLTAHAVKADDNIGLRIGIDVAEVQLAGHCGRRRIDREQGLARGRVELEDLQGGPAILQPRLSFAEIVLSVQSHADTSNHIADDSCYVAQAASLVAMRAQGRPKKGNKKPRLPRDGVIARGTTLLGSRLAERAHSTGYVHIPAPG